MKHSLVCLTLLLLASRAPAELIVNGNFEGGNTGFATAYMLSPGDIGPAGSYDIVSNPALSRPNDISPVSHQDHTSGSALMMAVNATLGGIQSVWSQTVPVTPNTDYDFSLWVSSWFGAPFVALDVHFNGTSVMDVTQPSQTALWENHSTTWNSGSSAALTIDIRNTSGADVGGDFSLDDISLTALEVAEVVPMPEPATLLLALVGISTLGWGYWRRHRATVTLR
jgi:hypothetical protein